MGQSAQDFASDLLRDDLIHGPRDARIRVLSADTSGLAGTPPLLTVQVAITQDEGPEYWQLTLRLADEDVGSLEDPVFREAMVVTVRANVMEWSDTGENPIIVRAIPTPGFRA